MHVIVVVRMGMVVTHERELSALGLDFTNIDRIQDHLDEDGDFELPAWHETEDDMDELYGIESLTKAVDLVRAGKVHAVEGRDDLYEVHGSELYACRIIEISESKVPGITCTCPNGQNRSGRPTCYHSAAAILVHTETDIDHFSMDFHL